MQIYNFKYLNCVNLGLERHPAAVDDYACGYGSDTGDFLTFLHSRVV